MADFPYRCALIVGAGPGISGSLAGGGGGERFEEVREGRS